jgi:prepilin-type N-terminal cleavage/methylation domain-containing protein
VSGHRDRPSTTDAGFTLIETIVSMGIIATVMGSMAAFYVRGTSVSRQQSDVQEAVRAATSAVERVHLLSGSSLLSGRTQAAVNAQYVAPGVSAYLNTTLTTLVWSTEAAITGLSLPTTAQQVPVAGSNTIFQLYFYVGECWALATDTSCKVVAATLRASRIPMYRVVVAVTWPGSRCAANLCSFVTSTLMAANTADPTF